ncbi:MAG: hypothetical protein ACHRXM_24950 [Isosphaerales bacterium]
MRTENLQEVIHAAPFRPFALCLADGTRVDVPHPDFIAHPPGGRTAVVVGPDERLHIIDVMLVDKIEIGPPVAAGTVRSGESE